MTDGVTVTTMGRAAPQDDDRTASEPARVTLDVAMKQVGVSRSTIDRWRRRGLLQSYRGPGVDRRVYVDAEQLQALVRPRLVGIS